MGIRNLNYTNKNYCMEPLVSKGEKLELIEKEEGFVDLKLLENNRVIHKLENFKKENVIIDKKALNKRNGYYFNPKGLVKIEAGLDKIKVKPDN